MNKAAEVANDVALATAQIIQHITNVQVKHFKMLNNKNVEMMGMLLKQTLCYQDFKVHF